jgi:dTDP-4-amino-4,6-dideoxygalactose transaminase
VAAAVTASLADGTWGKYHGPHVPRLIERLAADHGAPYVVLCASGTTAIELALRGLAIGPGDEVILAAYDFRSSFQNVLAVGATPVLVDLLPGNMQLDCREIAAAISPQTKAVIASHLHGGVVDMPGVVAVGRAHNVAVIEDAAQMPGARIHGRTAGTWGDIGILSFGGSKLVSAGRGGALVTSRDDVAQRVKLYFQRGTDAAYPLSEVQAAAVLPQWDRLAEANARRTNAVGWLTQQLTRVAGLEPFANPQSDSRPGYYKVGFRYDAAAFAGLARDRFAEAVRAEGIALDPGFRALHTTHSSRRFRAVGQLAHASRAGECILTLFHPVLLEAEEALQQIVTAIDKVREHAGQIAAT